MSAIFRYLFRHVIAGAPHCFDSDLALESILATLAEYHNQ